MPGSPYDTDPSPFKQPFLELTLAGDGVKRLSPHSSIIHIDVEGKIGNFITKEHEATEALINLCKVFAKAGVVVTEFARYKGSAGPHIVMRSGVLFYRMHDLHQPSAEVFAYEYRPPSYRGPR